MLNISCTVKLATQVSFENGLFSSLAHLLFDTLFFWYLILGVPYFQILTPV